MRTTALTAAFVAEAAGGRLLSGPAGRVFDGVAIDTRLLQPGALFVALRGQRDGHAYIADAIARGAGGVLVADAAAAAGRHDVPVVLVDDTLAALQAVARAIRRSSGAKVVAITGSAGKTTTKDVTADLLETRYRVFRNHGNFNNHIGLPLSLVELRHGFDVAVVELGMNHAGEIRTLVGVGEPDVRVWTNVGDAHIGYFGSRQAIAQAKAEILEDAPPEALAVLNADDPFVMQHAAAFAGRVITFGTAPAADVRATGVEDHGFDGVSASITTSAGSVDVQIPLAGRAHLTNVLAAAAVATVFDIPPTAIAGAIGRLKPVARRGESTVLPSGARLVDDSYNASPAAVEIMLQALASTRADGRRIAVLGEMLELGERAPALHEACGRAAARAGLGALVVIGGPAAVSLATGARDAGLDESRIHWFADAASAAVFVAGFVRPGDLVLVKGSRGTRTDIVADRLREVA
jgi:UDP-N-acetylmuramoyl-tripeptide--D-alanyl-D-alanine ligase